jgi:hypothetical protein
VTITGVLDDAGNRAVEQRRKGLEGSSLRYRAQILVASERDRAVPLKRES